MEMDKSYLSRRLYDVLENVGASESVREMHKQSSRVGEILDTIKLTAESNKTVRAHRCGSSYEGSVTPATSSDIDMIYGVDKVFPLVADIERAPDSLSLLMHKSAYTFPGYVKLRLLLDCRTITLADKDNLNGFEADNDGYFCFKHLSTGERAVANGPADAIFDKHGKHVFDSVFSFKCANIPTFDSCWTDRLAANSTLPKETISELKRMGCLVVGAGHMDSIERDIEYRLSFSLQERHLISRLNPIQHKVYILLKIIKEEILNKEIVGEKITSYHCKMCVLYAAMHSNAHAWNRSNLIGCLMTCLSILLQMVKMRLCPNFFIKDQNLFAKEGFRHSKKPLKNTLQYLLQDCPGFLFRIQTELLGQRLVKSEQGTSNYVTNDVASFKFNHKSRDIGAVLFCRRLLLKCTSSTELHCLLTDIDNFENSDEFHDKSEEDILRVKSYLAPTLHLYCAMTLAVRANGSKDADDRYKLIRTCESYLNKSANTDISSALLIRATVLLTFQKYEECLHLLRRIEDSCDGDIVYRCSCAGNLHEDQEIPDHVQRKQSEQSVDNLLRNQVATCIIFRPSEQALIPIPLRFEMYRSVGAMPWLRHPEDQYWFDWAVVDAKVYMYLMLYIVSSRLDKRLIRHAAKEHLRKLVIIGSGLGHKETALNLLGWMYVQEDQILEAMRCFMTSWRIRPYHNAAKFHVLSIWDRVKSLDIHM